MAILKTAPSPRAFADAWSKEFEAAVKKAAGKDGKLTRTEAWRLRESRDQSRFFSDDALTLLSDLGQRSATVSRLVTAGKAKAEAAAAAVAGANGKLSLTEGGKLPAPLREDFLWLRGKVPTTTGKLYTDAQLKAVVTRLVTRALDDGTAVKLPAPPSAVRGRKPVVDSIAHPATRSRAIAYVAEDVIYISRAQPGPPPAPLAGWYRVGPLP
ncbi:MAG: hypothetical protein IT380_04110 [Myxococcales bacterium]|nr:hypothetical protein [Myxococcales bacterium]